MIHEWSFYVLDGSINWRTQLGSLERLLRSSISIGNQVIYAEDSREGAKYVRKRFEIESEELISFMELVENKNFRIPTILSFAGNEYIKDLILGWIRSECGVIILPIEFNGTFMIYVVDAIFYASTLHFSETYRTKLIYDVDTENKNLKKLELELDKDTLKTFTDMEKRSVFEKCIMPYIREETGLILEKLTLSMISLAGFARINKRGISTFANTLETEILLTLLQRSQLD
ncbi:hypothetical protein HG535_0A02260 [Zygotorulaspora mrakii]|uniref:Uncharacterized protein n=1 Tax=Zygotorulaspora mrakii TaxID=42260 RepID=A0A7H9AVC0_ZYGMR|nr:uncharacterized protein HG535_0A02260 [Zygotorulaspora mrakii]QLG70288.1 hypothetical protein HG535_0A02260 [Zygotorulaspora mrakii]